MWEQYEGGNIKPRQVEAFFQEQVRTQWKVRPVVLVGQDVPYDMQGLRYMPRGWVLKTWMEQADWNGVWDGLGSGAHYTGAAGVLKGSAQQTPGEHEIVIRYYSTFYRGEASMDKDEIIKSKPVWEGKHEQRVKVKVLAKASEEYLRLVEAPELAAQIKASIEIHTVNYHWPEGIIIVHEPSENLAFDVFVQSEGATRWVMRMIAKRSAKNHLSLPKGVFEGLRGKKVDLIFRSNEELAGQTVDVFNIWKGEVVIEGVEIKKVEQ